MPQCHIATCVLVDCQTFIFSLSLDSLLTEKHPANQKDKISFEYIKYPANFTGEYKRTSLGEELARVLPAEGDVFRNGPDQLDDVRQVVLVARIVLARVRLEQVVARR